MAQDYPDNLYQYYSYNNNVFVRDLDKTKMCLYIFSAVILIWIGIATSDIPWHTPFVQFFLFCIIYTFVYTGKFIFSIYKVRATNNKISNIITKHFDLSEIEEHKLLYAFHSNDLKFLLDIPAAKRNDITLCIDQDNRGKKMYCLLMKKITPSFSQGISKIKIFEGDHYTQLMNLL